VGTRLAFEATRAEQFDRVYLESIVVLHTNLVARVQAVRRRIEDADTRVLLEETLATLERHRLMADELLRDDDLGDLSG
jgi:predicted outer membrane protein